MRAVVNENAGGAWARRAGEEVELVHDGEPGFVPGNNCLSACIRPANAKPVRIPARWIDHFEGESR